MKIGRRLAIKLLNASKFVLGFGTSRDRADVASAVTEALDRAMLAQLAAVVDARHGGRSSSYNYHQALAGIEQFFWGFCDDYLELVKGRAYERRPGPGAESAKAALRIALRHDAPAVRAVPALRDRRGVVVVAGRARCTARPLAATRELRALAGGADPPCSTSPPRSCRRVRKAKSTSKRSLRTDVTRLTVDDTPRQLAALRVAEADLRRAGIVIDLVLREAADPPSRWSSRPPRQPAAARRGGRRTR